ncbi:CDP-diacylglycerol--glycerol-3-phosphate 3-phosphatidyltransferase [Acidithiobacillus thiooxidans]|uniref:CDP-diacylglycerol--glycerol-3-phosphate 3-phosphatidyltransferase n=1 Tax=Acidithiobacillus thiooxidans TaxID=930 RepID=A0A1C2IDQ7_ACITH|nr:CDP-diacylglycerol--glycerol-3-phosphate 3-phosphatidyltransferase [Acidithiobacillus thiooxidans]MBU2838669.1 CDP-diacylglycerol--glycerol-3-phosphate 3-phosphatidyltransferase [Acidithiobacillus thiooxidans]OCX74111.1 CDP-diacylglycerol--glycerol-3-phosphate 3-phosphatidyltransferase [Acidithiobacillus thiooxidans]OCX74894.1 CDP-diacylglycerol--glycerol-3-phosphate 3-phosphatidyltransferase [Acidithiobacillus thiooxidans]OCX77019.1 CDP-diacylglycerol--glycerol-3-phosphate 3-phosphatidyltra
MIKRLPNYLTILRILLVPIFVALFYWGGEARTYAATAVFAIAAITDWADGYLARRYQGVSPFGTFLDPVADKIMVVTALILIASSQEMPPVLAGILISVIVGREITVSALREWMAELGERKKVAVSWLGKAKATTQMLAILFLVYREALWGVSARIIGIGLLVIAAIMTLWSMLGYLQAAWPSLMASGADLDKDG